MSGMEGMSYMYPRETFVINAAASTFKSSVNSSHVAGFSFPVTNFLGFRDSGCENIAYIVRKLAH